MAITKRLRYEILARDNNTCRYCHATDAPLTIDHVKPTALGGDDDPSNLVAACRDCNSGKSSSNPDAALVAQVSDDAVRWADAMKSAAERLAANKAEADEQLKPWFDEWFIRSGPGWSYKLPSDADDVLRQYLAAGMPIDVLKDAARVTLRKRNVDDRFRYFRGVANNMLAELQRDAAALLAHPAPQGWPESPDHPLRVGFRQGYEAAWEEIEAAAGGHTFMCLSRVVDGIDYPVMSA